MTVLDQLAEWAATTPARWSEVAFARAEHAIEDVIACSVAGASDDAARRVRCAIAAWGEGRSTVIGQSTTAPAPWAALANGTAAHALDYDDVFLPGATHATAVLFPALLALAEPTDTGGDRLLDAYIVGLEMQAAVGRGVNRSHYELGWHATATIGCIGAAAGCGRLLGLDATRMGHAISLAVSMASGPKVQFGTMAKPFHAGLAAQHAVLAATLAQAGLQGRNTALEGAFGFLELYGGPAPPGWAQALASMGEPLAIEELGLIHKRYPCCGSSHFVLDGLLALREQHCFAAKDVAAVNTVISVGNRRSLMYDDPRDEMQARFSLPYCVAVALLNGRLTLDDFTPHAVTRPLMRPLLELTSIRTHDAGQESESWEHHLPHKVEVVLKDGRILATERAHLRGSIHDPFDEADRLQKFHDCCESRLGREISDGLQSDLTRLRELGSLRTIMARLRFDAGV